MKILFWATTIVFILSACCKAICEDQRLVVWARNIHASDVDTVFLIKYKPGTNFTERIDTIKRHIIPPASAIQPVSFFELLESDTDWKVVIPALDKAYFISNIETENQRCECESGTYRTVRKFRFNNTEMEGSSIDLN